MHSWLRFRQPWVVLTAALLLTAIATGLAHRWVEARKQVLLATAVEFQLGRLNARMDAYIALLRATRALMQTQAGQVDRDLFRRYVERLRIAADFPGIQGIGYSPRLQPAQVADFERAAQAEGLEGFRVHPTEPRDWLFSILYLEPLDARNRAALGFDMFSEPGRAEAMARARDTGSLAMSGRVVLKQEIDQHKQAGFLVYVPLYGTSAPPATVQERRARLSGFVYAPFRAGDFFDSLFDVRAPLVAVRVHAGAAGEALELLHDGFPRDPSQWTRDLTIRSPEFGGQPWTLEFMALPGLVPSGERLLVPAVAVAGGLLSALLFLLARLQVHDRAEIERAASERAQALTRERAQRRLTESLSSLALSAGGDVDVGELLQKLVDEAARLTGATVGVFLPAPSPPSGVALRQAVAVDAAPPPGTLAALRASPAFATALAGGTLRLDAMTLDRRGTSPADAPPVAACLAACVCARKGSAFGVLFFCHPQPAHFASEHERLIESLAAQAAVVLENTALRQLEREALARTGAENTLLETFVGIASHDLRNPLNVILLSAALLDRGDGVSDKLKSVVGRIRRSGEQALRLVHDLLDFTQVRLGQGIPVAPLAADLQATVAQVVDEFRLAHPERTVLLEAHGDGLAIFDAHRVVQMVSNLLSNAVAHGEPGTPVRVRVDGDAGHVELSVHNEGPPIPDALRAELFQPLRRGEGRGSALQGSIGLGLFIVDQIARAHRGEVRVASGNTGTTFTVRLPRDPQ